MSKTVHVIDANGLFARAYYAASAAEPRFLDEAWRRYFLKSVFGLAHALKRPDLHLYCWDGKHAKTAKPRNDKPESYYVFRDAALSTTQAIFGRESCVQLDEYESDDLVATVALREANQDNDVVVVSGDKDLTQLVGPGVRYYCLNKKRLLEAIEIAERWGVHRPSQVSIALAIIGDKGDGINGVHRLGRKAVEKIFSSVVPRGVTLAEAVRAVELSLNPDQRQQFLHSFQFTLLNAEVPGVGDPVAFELTPPEELDVDWKFDYEQLVCIDDPDAMERHLDRLTEQVNDF